MNHHDLLHELKRYVLSQSSASALESWILSHYQQTIDSGDERVIDLANELNALFVEYGEDVITEQDLNCELEMILHREESSQTFTMGEPPVRSSSDRSVKKYVHISGQVFTVRQELRVA